MSKVKVKELNEHPVSVNFSGICLGEHFYHMGHLFMRSGMDYAYNMESREKIRFCEGTKVQRVEVEIAYKRV